MAQPQLNADALVDQAVKATGLDSFDSESYREGLTVFVDDFNRGIAQGIVTDGGIERAANDCVTYLGNRLRVADYLRQNPELTSRKIERPVFVFGIPRTGTTLLSNLLAADPARRSPLEWEIEEPVPPAQAGMLKTDPRALAKLEAHRAMLEARPEMGKVYRSSPIYPHECVWFLAHDFKTLMIESKGKLPGYREFIFGADMTSAYSYHRKFLQTLQHHNTGVWNLKMPSHALHLDYLIKEYPDARLVWTHRDPYSATASLCSIISMSHYAYLGKPDTEWLGENYPWQAQQHAERIMDFRDKHGEDRVIDVHYDRLLDDPLATMKALYKALGDEWTSEAEAGIQGWIDDNPQNKFGKHEYKLAQYGLTKDDLVPLFERYLARYDVAMEG
ncbi:sulfotransferase family protein [Novosphingobium sp. PC22D]|uniref:sulfotransferase family protein n=1 Tax=Novosphingobium sp. PC22D TaxID=1962403 RepID=UPI000BF1FCA0|nr:sulfotransferase [Novosphingobium sp. PC22D]PEQ11823.1 sulfotransferase family protein [Novosphingobium sp. PC22D]